MSRTKLPAFGKALQSASQSLLQAFQEHHQRPSDINEHLPLLREKAKLCNSVVEIGVRNVVSTWGLLLGLIEAPGAGFQKTYHAMDLNMPSEPQKLEAARKFAKEAGVEFQFLQGDDLKIPPIACDLLFIDTWHIFPQLVLELETWHNKARKYIVMHDTSDPWGNKDENEVTPQIWQRYPNWIPRGKHGLWPAVQYFLQKHGDEWQLDVRKLNNSGLTVLRRYRTL